MTDDFLQFYTSHASLALLYYDYCLTFPDEVKYIWGAKFRLSTALYICCRYALVGNLLYLLAIDGKLSGEVRSRSARCSNPPLPSTFLCASCADYDVLVHCTSWYMAIAGLSVFGRVAVVTTFTVRTWALYNNKNMIVLGILGSVGLATIIVDAMHVPGVRCVGSASKPISLVAILMFAFELLSGILTLYRCYRTMSRLRGWGPLKQTFHYMVLEQGLVYYATTAVLSSAKLILNYAAPPDSYIRRVTNAFVLPILCVLTARFILHLREWEHKMASGCITSKPPGRLSMSIRDDYYDDGSTIMELGSPTTVTETVTSRKDWLHDRLGSP